MPGTTLKLKIMRDECIGDGACADAAPGTFEMDRESICCVRSLITDAPETILKTARACPTDAIVVFDAESGEQLVPEP